MNDLSLIELLQTYLLHLAFLIMMNTAIITFYVFWESVYCSSRSPCLFLTRIKYINYHSFRSQRLIWQVFPPEFSPCFFFFFLHSQEYLLYFGVLSVPINFYISLLSFTEATVEILLIWKINLSLSTCALMSSVYANIQNLLIKNVKCFHRLVYVC